jgi:hypothetical protein
MDQQQRTQKRPTTDIHQQKFPRSIEYKDGRFKKFLPPRAKIIFNCEALRLVKRPPVKSDPRFALSANPLDEGLYDAGYVKLKLRPAFEPHIGVHLAMQTEADHFISIFADIVLWAHRTILTVPLGKRFLRAHRNSDDIEASKKASLLQ